MSQGTHKPNGGKVSFACMALALVLMPLLSGCDRIEAIGNQVHLLVEASGRFAVWTALWFLPAAVLFVWIASDTRERETVTGSVDGKSCSLDVPTGRTIPGNPDLALFVLRLWITAYPAGWSYWPLWREADIVITGLPNLDWTVLKIAIPVGILAALAGLVALTFYTDGRLGKALRWCWYAVVGGAAANLLLCLLVAAVRWLCSK